jgi:hypothetical protein
VGKLRSIFYYINKTDHRSAEYIQMRANKVLLRNNFEIITMDLSQLERGFHWRSYNPPNTQVHISVLCVPKSLIRVSSAAKKLIMKLCGWISQKIRRSGQSIDTTSELINSANAALQVVGELESITLTDCPALVLGGKWQDFAMELGSRASYAANPRISLTGFCFEECNLLKGQN